MIPTFDPGSWLLSFDSKGNVINQCNPDLVLRGRSDYEGFNYSLYDLTLFPLRSKICLVNKMYPAFGYEEQSICLI